MDLIASYAIKAAEIGSVANQLICLCLDAADMIN